MVIAQFSRVVAADSLTVSLVLIRVKDYRMSFWDAMLWARPSKMD